MVKAAKLMKSDYWKYDVFLFVTEVEFYVWWE